MQSDFFGWIFSFLQSAWIWAFHLELPVNKETLLGYLFADVHSLFKKREKEKILHINRASANNYFNFTNCLRGASVKRFPTRQEVKVSSHTQVLFCFWLFFCNTLCFIVTISFSWQQTPRQHLKGTLERGLKKSLNIVFQQALQLDYSPSFLMSNSQLGCASWTIHS